MLPVYLPKFVSSKPEWFNGFLSIGQYSKNANWSKCVYLPDYYRISTDNKENEIRLETVALDFNIMDATVKHFENTEHKEFDLKTKTERCAKIVNRADIINSMTGFVESHPCLYVNKNFVIRPAVKSDKPSIKKIAEIATEEIGIPITMVTLNPSIEKGLMLVVVDSMGELCGIQTFSFMKRQISHEPLTYIGEKARGQGIFNVYHDIVIELGKEINAKYVYVQCNQNSKINDVYKHYGYIKQDETVNVSGHEYFIYHFPLEPAQQTFF